jgi:uncharacterized repeat protein (TIGR01451 family)
MTSVIAPGIFLGVFLAALAAWVGATAASGNGATSGSQVHVVLQIHTKPGLANDSIVVDSTQLTFECSSVTYETLQGGSTAAPRTSLNSIVVVLDSDGNAAVTVDAVNCAPGTAVVEAALTVAPFYDAQTKLTIDPPGVLKLGLTANPKTEVESGNTAASGESNIYSVFYVSAPPVWAGKKVEIESPQLEDRCGLGWRWEPNGGTAVNGVPPVNSNGTAVSILDDDGNASFVFKGSSCADGTSTVIADVLAGGGPSYKTTFKVTAPSAKATKKVAKAAADTKAKKKAKAPKVPKNMITLTASPSPVTDIGFTPSGDLGISKIDNDGGSSITSTLGSAVPGTSITYTIVASNAGPTNVSGASVTDALALNPAFASDSWTALGSGGANGFAAAGNGNIADSVNLPAGSFVTYTVVAALRSSATGTLSNTAAVTAPPGFTDSNLGNNAATDSDTLKPSPTLSITKTDNDHGAVVAGAPITYTVVVSNSGISDATNMTVTDLLPAQGLTNISSPNLPAGVTFSPTTNSWSVASLPVGAHVTVQLAGTVPTGATGASYANTASAAAPGATTVSITDSDLLSTQATLGLTKTDGVSSVTAGNTDTYTMVVSNTGPSDAANVTVVDTLPTQGLTGLTSPNLPAGVTFNSTTDTWSLASLPAGQSVTLKVSGTVPSGATGPTYVNSATASATDATGVPATDTDSLNTQATLGITKTDGVSSVIAGNTDTYTIVVSNSGPSDAANVAVADTLPTQGLTGITSPNLPAGVTFNSTTDAWTVGTLAAGTHVTLTLTGTVPPGAAGSTYANTAAASASDATTVSATDSDSLDALASLALTKSDNDGGNSGGVVGSAVPGTTITYTVTASNNGPSNAANVVVSDTLPTQGLANITSPNLPGGVTFNAVTGAWTVGTLGAGQAVTLTLTGTIPSAAQGTTYRNAAVASASDASTVSATDIDNLGPMDDLTLTKTDNDGGSVVAGSPITYTIVAHDSGPSDAAHLTVVDSLPSQGLTNITSPNLPAGAVFNAASNTWSMLTLAAGQSITLQLQGTVPSDATGSTYVNSATASATDATTMTATDTDTLSTHATLAVTKTDGVSAVTAGTADTYTVVVSNTGPSDAANVTVADSLPTQGLTGLTSPNLPAGVTFNAATGTWTLASLPSGQSVTLKLSGTVPSGASGATYANTATASASNAASVSATDTDTLASHASLAVTKTDNDGGSSATGVTGTAVPGTIITYTIVASNSGPSTATGVSVSDPLAADPSISSDTWTASGTGGATGFGVSGTGTIADTPVIPAGGSVTYTVVATLSSSATGTLANTVTASAADASTVSATDSDTLKAQTTLTVTKTDGVTSVVAGTSDTYTIVVTNTGPSDATNVAVADTLPTQGLTGLSSPSLPVGASFNPTTHAWTLGTVASGQSVTLQLQGTVPSAATGAAYANTATVTASDAATVHATDTDTLSSQVTLGLTKTDGVTSVVAGTSDTYTVVVSNTGPSDATGVSVADTLPAQGLANISSPSLPAGATFNAGTDTWNVASLPAGQSVSLQLQGTVPSGATGATYANTATATAVNAATVSATDTDTLGAQAVLTVTKTDNDGGSSATRTVGTAVPGTSITYSIVVANTGPSTAAGVSMADTLPTQGLTNITSPGLPAGVTFNSTTDTWTLATLAAGQSVTVQLSGTVPSAATGILSNTAVASATDSSAVSATDTDSLSARATLAVTKTDNDGGSSITLSTGSAAPGTSITYTIVASNSGPSTATGASVTDPLALNPNITSDSWTAVSTGGATGFSAVGTGTIADSLTIPAGGSVTYTVTAAISTSATGTLSNTATASASDATAVSASDSDTLGPRATLTLTKSDGVSSVTAGSTDTYTMVVSNTGPSDATSVSIADTLPAQGLTNITSPSLPVGVTFSAATNRWSLATLGAGQSVTLTLAGTVPSGATGATYTNSVTASASDATAVTAADSDNLSSQANLTLTKTDGTASVVPGTSDTYTMVVSDTGPSDASNVSVTDTVPAQGLTNITSPSLPAGVTFNAASHTWTLATLAAGQSVTLTLSGTVPSGATGASYVNTASAGAANATTVSATDTDTLNPSATLTVTKTDNDGGSSVTPTTGSAVPGTSITYTIVATNAGPSDAIGAHVTDPLATNPALSSDTWTATATGGATGFSASGTGAINDTATIPAGAKITYSVVATISSSATGTLTNTATASAPDATTVTATDTDTLGPKATLAVTKTDNDGGSSITPTVGSAVPGSTITYTIVATNSGPSTATGASVTDALALNPAIGSDIWTATATGGATGFSASGSGSIADSLVIPVGASVTYTVIATIAPSATGTMANTATAAAADAPTVSATDNDALSPHAALAITKTDGISSVVAGTSDTYTVVVTNNGPSDAGHVSVVDAVPAQGLTNVSSPGLPAGVAFTSGTDTWSVGTLAAGQSVTLQLQGTVPSGASGPTFANTATASATDAGFVSATDSDALTSQATLAVTKTDGISSVVAGTSDTYTIVASNTGPSDAANVTVVDTLPVQGLMNIASPSLPGGVTFNAGSDTWSLATLASGQSVTLQLQGTVPAGATGPTYANTATASAGNAGAVSATDSDSLSAHSTLGITKTDNDGGSSITAVVGRVVPGTTITYTVVATNSGPSTAAGTSITDALATNPAIGSDTWTATGSGGATGFSPSGTGSINDSASIPSGGSVTYTVTASVLPSATGTLSNTASASASDATTVTATDTDTLGPKATLAITKTDNDGGSSITPSVGSAVPGSSITYTIVATNSGPSTATGASVTDALALNPALTSAIWTATGAGGATGFSASGRGTMADAALTIPAGGSVTYTVIASLASSATGTVSNVATTSASDAVTTTATDTDTLTPVATLGITKSDGTSSVVAGTTDTYAIVVSDTGLSDATNVSVVDSLPAQGLTNVTSPGLPAGVTFNPTTHTWTLATLSAGQSVTLNLSGTVPSGATGSYVNSATASASDASTVSVTDTDSLSAQATLAITKTDGVTSVVAGTSDTYTIGVTNTGPSDASGLSVVDTLPAQGLTNLSSPGLPAGVTFNSSTDTWSLATLTSGQSVSVTLRGTVPSTIGAGSTYANSATASATDAPSVTATDTDTVSAQAALALTKTDNDGGSSTTPTTGTAVPGRSITYTVVASNSGPSTATGATVADPLGANPAIGSDTWTAVGSGGATGFSASGTGSIGDSVTIPSGGSVAYTVVAAIRSSATGTLSNTATASATDATTVTATDSDSLSAQATLGITKTDGASSVVAGHADSYAILVSNTGPSDASNVTVVDGLPAQGLTNITSPSLPAGVTFNAATNTWALASLGSGQSVTLNLSGTVPSGATGATYVNTATASASDAPTVSATDSDTLTAQSTLIITKTDNDGGSSVTGAVGTAVPGHSVTYTVVTSNSGPSTTTGATVTDPLALNPALSSDTWTAVGSGGATGFSASGSGTINDSVTLPSGAAVTYTVVAVVRTSASGTLSNTATASASDASTVSATDTDSLTAQAALTITKSDGVSSVVAGTSDTYAIVVTNTGPSDATNLSVADTLPTQGLASITSPGLPAGVTFTAATDTWTLASLGSGQSVTVTLSGTVPAGASGATYVITATASASDATTVTATDSDTLNSQATLGVTKSDGVSSVVAGTTDTYAIVVTNTGPSDATNLSVADTLPVQGLTSITSPGLPAGATFNAATNSWNVATLASGQSVTLTLSGTVPSGATGATYINKVTASASDASAVSATDTDSLTAHANVSITKSDNRGGSSVTPSVGSATAGSTITYTVVAANSGPSTATAASVTDPLALNAALASDTWTAVGSGGATGFSASGTGSISDAVILPSGASVTYTVLSTIRSSATGTLANTATASASDATTMTATDTDTLNSQATLGVTKSDGVSSVVAGTSDTYAIVVTNTGPSDATNLSVADTLPVQGLTSITSPGLPTSATFNAATNSWSLASLASGQSVTLTLSGTVPSGATGATYINKVTASASDASAVSATDSDTLISQTTLSITKSDGVTSVVAGTGDTYTVVVSNTGPADAANLSVVDTLPAQGLSAVTSPGLPAGVTFNSSTDTWTLATLTAGQSVTLELQGTVPSGATGPTYANTAAASASDAPTVSATDTDALSSQATLAVTKTDNDGGSSVTGAVGTAVPGRSVTYTIVASNSGPSTTTGATVTDPLAFNPAVASDTWTATASAGTTGFSASGTGSINDSVTMPSGGSVTYTVVATLRSTATGTLSNTATVSATDAVTVTATDTDTLGPQATMAITKTDSGLGSSVTGGVGTAVPGRTLTYTIVATNSGPSTATGASVTDALALNPAIGSDSWTATGSGGATGFGASGTASINDSLTLPSGASVTYTVVAALRSSASGTLSNTATASATDATTVSATDNDTLAAQAALTVTKSDGVSSVVAGSSDTYAIVVSNTGPSDASNLSVVDALPAQGLSAVSSPALPAGVTFASATDTWSLASLASGQSVTLELQGTVPAAANGASYINSATASASDASAVTATDTDSLTTQATLSITKTDNDGGSSATAAVGTAVAGRTITYTIVASNSGPSITTGASVTDALALNPAISSDTWTATGSGGATGFSTSGTGNISDTPTIPAGGSVTYSVVATIQTSATGTLSNTATASANNASTVTATDTDTLGTQANLAITKTDGVSSVVAGASDSYTITVSNTGPSDAANVSVVDSLPVQGLTNVSSTSLPAGTTFNAGSNTWSLASLPVGQSVTVQLAGTVPSGATGATYTNTATASAADASAVSVIDTDTLTAHATLAITQTDGVSSVVAGGPNTYTIVVSDSGPSDASNLSVVDILPVQGLTNLSSPGLPAGITFNAGTGNWTLSSLAAGQSVTLQLTGTVSAGATGSYANTVTTSASDASAVSATDSDSVTFKANLTLTTTDNDGGSSITGAVGTAVPGTSITYTVVAANAGPSNVTGAEIYDPVAEMAGIGSDTWTATGTGGAVGFTASGSGDFDDIVSVPAGGSITYTVVAAIRSSATSTLSNRASITPSPSLTNTNPLAVGGTVNTTDTDTLAQAHLSITNSDGVTSLAPGSSTTYTIVVSNSGPSTAANLTVTDTPGSQGLSNVSSPSLPAGVTFNAASATWTLATLASGQSVTLQLAGTVPGAATGTTYANTAGASASDASAVSATDTDSLGRQGDATITLTDSDGGSSITGTVGSVKAGTTITYTIVAANTGPSTVNGAETYNPVSEVSGITSDSWTATGTGGAVGYSPTGSGDIDDIVVIPAGASITYTVVATVSSSASGTMSNSVSLTPPPSFTNTNPLAAFGSVTATDRDTITSS